MAGLDRRSGGEECFEEGSGDVGEEGEEGTITSIIVSEEAPVDHRMVGTDRGRISKTGTTLRITTGRE
jgi:hypothetical protein